MKTKTPSVKLSAFDFVAINSAAIQLNQIEIEADDGSNDIIYNATYVLWISDKDIPIIVPTEIYDECEFCTINQAMSALLVLTDIVNDNVLILDAQGDIIEELSLDEIFDEDEDESDEVSV